MRRTITLALALLTLVTCTPRLFANDLSYGEPRHGVQAAFEDLGNARFRLHLLNRNPAPVDLSKGFAWLLLVESRDKALFSGKLALASDRPLPPDASWSAEYDLQQLTFYPFRPGARLVDDYPADLAGPLSPATLAPTLRAQVILSISVAGERTALRTRARSFVIRDHAPTSDPAAEELLRAFRRDAFAAQRAHEKAVLTGEPLLPSLTAALDDKSMPDYALMWIATTIIHINAGDAPEIAAKLADHPAEGIRNVLAYHGPSMKRELVDRAILTRAATGNDPLFTAWAARGFAQARRSFPDTLTTAALSSREPRARAEIADVLAATGDPRLSQLARDSHDLVRIAVVDALARHDVRSRELNVAIAESLTHPSPAARQRIVAYLASLSGQNWRFSPELSPLQSDELFEAIRTWAHQSDGERSP